MGEWQNYYSLRHWGNIATSSYGEYNWNNVQADALTGISIPAALLVILCAPVYFRMFKSPLAFWAYLFTTVSHVCYTATSIIMRFSVPKVTAIPELVGLIMEIGGMMLWFRFLDILSRHAVQKRREVMASRVLHTLMWTCGLLTAGCAVAYLVLFCVEGSYYYAISDAAYVVSCIYHGLWIGNAAAGLLLSMLFIWRVQNADESAFLLGEKIWIQLSLVCLFLNSFMQLLLQAALSDNNSDIRYTNRMPTVRNLTWVFLTLTSAGLVFTQSRLMVFWMRAMYSVNFQEEEEVELFTFERNTKDDSDVAIAPSPVFLTPNRMDSGFKSTVSLHLGPSRKDSGFKSGSSTTITALPTPSDLRSPFSPLESPTESTAALSEQEPPLPFRVEETVVRLPFKPIVRVPLDVEKVEFTILKIRADDERIERIRAITGKR